MSQGKPSQGGHLAGWARQGHGGDAVTWQAAGTCRVAPGSSKCPTQTDLSEPSSSKLAQGRRGTCQTPLCTPRKALRPLPSPAVDSGAANRPQRLHASMSPSTGVYPAPELGAQL